LPAISANGTSNAILWAAENGTTGALHAYDATNLGRELYNSNQAGTRDQWGAGNKFITPMISRGKVYSARPTASQCSGCCIDHVVTCIALQHGKWRRMAHFWRASPRRHGMLE
jgi:hypothetical protein